MTKLAAEFPTKAIAGRFGLRTHSTVVAGAQRIEARLAKGDRTLAEALEQLTERIRPTRIVDAQGKRWTIEKGHAHAG